MVDFADAFSDKLRLLGAGLLIVACLVVLPFLPGLLSIPTVQAAKDKSSRTEDAAMTDSPNAITRGMFSGAEGLERAASSAENIAVNSSRSAANATMAVVTTSGRFVAHTAGSGALLVVRGISGSAAIIGQTATSVFRFIGNAPSVGAIIRPADNSKIAVPVIDSSDRSEYVQALANGEESSGHTASQPTVSLMAQWPMHGIVTTEFGVPHWPYQPIHSGIDISDQKASGTTPIHPFKPGVVKETVRSNVGLGNRVIVDHGAGITSVYAHLSSIAVRSGQMLNMGSVLGYAGSTGASTGTHLHFEIRDNNQSISPRKYISGQP